MFNLTLFSLSAIGWNQFSPLVANQRKVQISSSHFSRIFSTLLYSSQISSLDLRSSSFEYILQPVVKLDKETGKLFTSRLKIENSKTKIKIDECTFNKCGNEKEDGGALYIKSGGDCEIIGTGFSNCHGNHGGSIYCDSLNSLTMNGCCIFGSKGKTNSIMNVKTNDHISIQQTYISDCYGSSESSCEISSKKVEITDLSISKNNADSSSLLSISGLEVLRDCYFAENKGNSILDVQSVDGFAGQRVRFEKNNANNIISLKNNDESMPLHNIYIINDESKMISNNQITFIDSIFSESEEKVKEKLKNGHLGIDNKFGTTDAPAINIKPSDQCWKHLPTPDGEKTNSITTGQKIAIAILVIFIFVIVIIIVRKFLCQKNGGMEPLRYTV